MLESAVLYSCQRIDAALRHLQQVACVTDAGEGDATGLDTSCNDTPARTDSNAISTRESATGPVLVNTKQGMSKRGYVASPAYADGDNRLPQDSTSSLSHERTNTPSRHCSYIAPAPEPPPITCRLIETNKFTCSCPEVELEVSSERTGEYTGRDRVLHRTPANSPQETPRLLGSQRYEEDRNGPDRAAWLHQD